MCIRQNKVKIGVPGGCPFDHFHRKVNAHPHSRSQGCQQVPFSASNLKHFASKLDKEAVFLFDKPVIGFSPAMPMLSFFLKCIPMAFAPVLVFLAGRIISFAHLG